MSYALPIISTNVGSIAEAVQEGINGFLIAPGDVNALADSMTKLTVDTELGRKSHPCLEQFVKKVLGRCIFKNVEKSIF